MQYNTERVYMAILAMTIIAGTFYLGEVLLTKSIPTENRDIINVALGLILGLSGTVVGYYFGSSKSSSDKTDIFKGSIDNKLDSDIVLRRRFQKKEERR